MPPFQKAAPLSAAAGPAAAPVSGDPDDGMGVPLAKPKKFSKGGFKKGGGGGFQKGGGSKSFSGNKPFGRR